MLINIIHQILSVTDEEIILKRPNMSEAIYASSGHTNTELLLEEVNAQEVLSLYPLLFFYSTILIIGALGNALVLLVYSFRYRRSPARVYILFLAAIDFLMCSFGLPYHLIDMTHPYTYTNASACKALTFIITTLFHTSIFGLIVIAIDRYLKICKPLGKVQISFFGKKRACGAAILAAVLMSWPNIVLYGPSEMESPNGNITGHACFFETSYLETNYPFIYIMSTLCICIGSTIFLIVSYSLIVHKVCTRYKSTKVKSRGRSPFDDTTLTEEICFRNEFVPAQEEQNYETSFTISSKQLMKGINDNFNGNSNIVENLPNSGNSHNYNEKSVLCNSNGSLAFVREEDKKSITNLQYKNPNNKLSDDTTEPLLSTNADSATCENNKYNVIVKFKNTKGGSKSMDACLNLLTDLQHLRADTFKGSLISVNSERIKTPGSLNGSTGKSSISEVNAVGLRKDGRYSLQVPTSVTPSSTTISFRRTSDLTGAHSDSIAKHWKQCSSLALKSLKNNNVFQDEGLRINNSCQSVNVSSQGTFKANKTVTKQHSKLTKIMLTITMIFVLSYSPALVVTIWTAVQPEFWDVLDERETVLCEFLLRFYLINNICNPFIYGFWDKRFKREIVFTFRKLSMSLKDRLSCCNLKKTLF